MQSEELCRQRQKRELEPWLATALLIYAWDVPVNRFAKCVYACIGCYIWRNKCFEE